jgi:hypothetical protein
MEIYITTTEESTYIPLIEMSESFQRYAVIPNPETTSGTDEALQIEEVPAIILSEVEYEEIEYIKWMKVR